MQSIVNQVSALLKDCPPDVCSLLGDFFYTFNEIIYSI